MCCLIYRLAGCIIGHNRDRATQPREISITQNIHITYGTDLAQLLSRGIVRTQGDRALRSPPAPNHASAIADY